MALAGARVTAADWDPSSVEAASLNLNRNKAVARVTPHWDPTVTDTLILADFLYDESNLEMLRGFTECCSEILVVDSRLQRLEMAGFQHLRAVAGAALPDLDPHGEFAIQRVWYKGNRQELWQNLWDALE
jgi:predicted nicotinamide N-methyase